MSFAERIEMVRSCRYVDEAVEIPLQYNDTREAYKLYRFDARGTSSSHISNLGGGCEVETIALDETVYDREPTYIKMDIEGAEQEALKGCRKIIQDYRPKLAICIYHKPEDFFEIPIMIKEMNPVYKLYVRQYMDAWYDTVLYAV